MIYRSLSFVTEQLNNYLHVVEQNNPEITPEFVKLKNIAHLSEEEIKNAANIYVTLVNVAEEFTLKNSPDYARENDRIVYRNAPIYLNLFVLFSSCVSISYDHSLLYLSHVVEFFQGKNTFTTKNSPTSKEGLGDFKITLDLYSPTFEQANYLWSTLGGKQFPYVLYKLRLVEVFRDNTVESRGIIKEITIQETI